MPQNLDLSPARNASAANHICPRFRRSKTQPRIYANDCPPVPWSFIPPTGSPSSPFPCLTMGSVAGILQGCKLPPAPSLAPYFPTDSSVHRAQFILVRRSSIRHPQANPSARDPVSRAQFEPQQNMDSPITQPESEGGCQRDRWLLSGCGGTLSLTAKKFVFDALPLAVGKNTRTLSLICTRHSSKPPKEVLPRVPPK